MPLPPLGRPPANGSPLSKKLRYEFEQRARELDKQITRMATERDRLRDATKALRQ